MSLEPDVTKSLEAKVIKSRLDDLSQIQLRYLMGVVSDMSRFNRDGFCCESCHSKGDFLVNGLMICSNCGQIWNIFECDYEFPEQFLNDLRSELLSVKETV